MLRSSIVSMTEPSGSSLMGQLQRHHQHHHLHQVHPHLVHLKRARIVSSPIVEELGPVRVVKDVSKPTKALAPRLATPTHFQMHCSGFAAATQLLCSWFDLAAKVASSF